MEMKNGKLRENGQGKTTKNHQKWVHPQWSQQFCYQTNR
jgi:hypothetical protein